jgi:hypothetical protein
MDETHVVVTILRKSGYHAILAAQLSMSACQRTRRVHCSSTHLTVQPKLLSRQDSLSSSPEFVPHDLPGHVRR